MANQIRFGDWNFDPDANHLVKGSSDCKLQPRIARLLEYFLNHPDQVLSHDHLIRAVWDGRTVSDDAVRRAVSSLRRALAVDGANAFIKTIARKGYRAHFPAPGADIPPGEVAQAGMAAETGMPGAAQERAQSWHVLVARRARHLVWATAMLLVLAFALWAALAPHDTRRAPGGIASARAINACTNVDAKSTI